MEHAEKFVQLLNEKFGSRYDFVVGGGRKYIRIAQKYESSSQWLVHAFVEASTGYV